MRPNAFQKILSLIYLVLLAVSCIFYVPFRNMPGRYNTEIVYDAIWSDNSNIDLYRIGIYLLVLSVTFHFLYRYLNKMNDLDVTIYKKKAKNELIAFLIFISGIAICLIFLISSNGINQIRKKSFKEDIQKNQTLIVEKAAKRSIRSSFWNASRRTFNLEIYSNNIQDYWDFLIKNKVDDNWLNYYYSKFPREDLNEFNIKNANDLKRFIEVNTYNNNDIKNQDDVRTLNTEINLYQSKLDSITFYQDEEIRKITLICLTVLFGLLFIARPLLLFIKGIFIELR